MTSNNPDSKVRALMEALGDVVDPVNYLRKRAEIEGASFNGVAAALIANDPEFIKGIAQKALEVFSVSDARPKLVGTGVQKGLLKNNPHDRRHQSPQQAAKVLLEANPEMIIIASDAMMAAESKGLGTVPMFIEALKALAESKE